jgi:hypothetical protein
VHMPVSSLKTAAGRNFTVQGPVIPMGKRQIIKLNVAE